MRDVMERLAGELRELERELRVDLPREIRTAIAMGDLRENAEYHAALERQAFVKARIGQLRERLSSLASIDLSRLPRGQAALGSKLTLRDLDNDQELRYELVLPELADLDRGWVSIGSPIGRGLIGRKTGDVVEIQIPSGRRRLEILELRTVHDGA